MRNAVRGMFNPKGNHVGICLLAIALLNTLGACLYGGDETDLNTNRTDTAITLNEDGKPILPELQINTSAASLTTPECDNAWSLNASLNWGGVGDWDFHLQTPNAHIYYGNRSADGFTLSHDAFPNCFPSGSPPEVITGNGKCGTYRLFSHLFSTCGGIPPITFSATVTALKPIIINGTALNVGQTFQPMNGVPFTVEPRSFKIAGKLPLPPPDNDPDSQFASPDPQNATECKPKKANENRADGMWVAHQFLGLGAIEASELLLHFLTGTGEPRDYPDGSPLSQAVKADSDFIAFDKEVQAAAAAQFNAGHLDAEVTPSLKVLNFNNLLFTSPKLYWAFRGTQGLDVDGSGYVQGSSYTGTITYTIRDIYGFANNYKFAHIGKEMHYLQGICGTPYFPAGARWFRSSVTVTVPFNQPL